MEKLDQIEAFLNKKILPDLEHSRGGFDKIHTLEVVEWIKRIIDNNPQLKLDKIVLVISAYAHDWGYSGIFKKGEVMNAKIIEEAKSLHMTIGAEKIKNLLNDSFFSLKMRRKDL